MARFRYVAFFVAWVVLCSPTLARGETMEFDIGQLITGLRAMVGKPLLDQTIQFSNEQNFTLTALTPEGSRFYLGGTGKMPGETVDEMRQRHAYVVALTPCPGTHDLTAKISSVAIWQTLSGAGQVSGSQIALGLEQLLAMMNTPAGVVTPSTLRVPRVRSLHGPVFEYVRGDITETLSFVNEGAPLRLNWTSSNTGICPR